MAVKVQAKIEGLQDLEKRLKSLVPMIRGKKGFAQNPLRTAARKGADVIVDSASQKARRFDRPDTPIRVHENIGRKPISVKERDKVTGRGDSLEGYDIGLQKKAWYGIFKELGTDRQPAQPFLRPALEEKRAEAVKVFKESLTKSLDMIVEKLARQ